MLWSGFKAVGRETLRTDCRILSDLADNKAVDVRPRHIIAEHVSDSAGTLILKLRGMGRKRSAALKLRDLPPKKARTKAAKTTKRNIFA